MSSIIWSTYLLFEVLCQVLFEVPIIWSFIWSIILVEASVKCGRCVDKSKVPESPKTYIRSVTVVEWGSILDFALGHPGLSYFFFIAKGSELFPLCASDGRDDS